MIVALDRDANITMLNRKGYRMLKRYPVRVNNPPIELALEEIFRRAWQGVVDEAGLAHYRRHHCGYAVGIGLPPSWTGGNTVVGLRADSDLEIREGMTFHVLSWLMETGRGDGFFSNTVLVGPAGAEVLTRTARDREPLAE